MNLVVDTNILLSFFRENPVRQIIVDSSLLNLKLNIPQYATEELKKNKPDVLKYSKLSPEQFNGALSILEDFLKIHPKEFFKEFEAQARQLIHEKDVPFFALALKLNCAIWSNEPAFKKQSKIGIFSTRELRELLKGQ